MALFIYVGVCTFFFFFFFLLKLSKVPENTVEIKFSEVGNIRAEKDVGNVTNAGKGRNSHSL